MDIELGESDSISQFLITYIMKNKFVQAILVIALGSALVTSCKPKNSGDTVSGDAAQRVYVAPGKYDEFYNFVSGGFSGQMSVYGLPSGRMMKVVPIFSVDPESGWGFSEETKPMLNTSEGFIPWDDQHHLELSQTNGEVDGRWIFANANNTPRIARVDLKRFKTSEIIELPNSAGNHSSPFITENTEYVVAGTRFGVPGDYDKGDVPINTYKENFKAHISFIKVDKESGKMDLSFQLRLPGVNFDLSHAGKGKSHGWFFFTCYNSEQANTLLEVNASQKDKDFIMAVNWKKAEEYIKAGKGKKEKAKYAHNTWNDETHSGTSVIKEEVLVLDAMAMKDICYLMPCPKSPHGCDVDPTGEYIVGSGKLAALIPVFSFDKMTNAIAKKDYEGDYEGIPVLKYNSVLHGEVQKPGLGPLHTEFDGKGNAYTSFFVSSEVVKWDIKSLKVLDRVPTYYSVGHLMIPGGDSKKPFGKYLVAYNKITKDRFECESKLDFLRLTLADIQEYTDITKEYFDNQNKRSLKKIDKFIFLGTLLGRHIPKIAKKVNAKAYLILEKNLEIFRLSLFTVDYTVLARNGAIYRLVNEKNIAYHAGKSQLPDGRKSVNSCSIGIELVTSFSEAPTEAQINALVELVKDIKNRYKIKYVLRHSDIAPERKTDPWNMDWENFRIRLNL